jgi:hypothetical protein
LAALSSKKQVPRWIRAICGSVAEAGVKSPGSQPEVELGSGVGGITKSLVGTMLPVTLPLPEKSNVPVSYVVGVGETWESCAGASSRKNGNVNSCSVTLYPASRGTRLT